MKGRHPLSRHLCLCCLEAALGTMRRVEGETVWATGLPNSGFKLLQVLWRCRMNHIKKKSHSLFCWIKSYTTRVFSIMCWFRKSVQIQRMLRFYASRYWEFKVSTEKKELSSDIPIMYFIMDSTPCFLDLIIPSIDDCLFWITTLGRNGFLPMIFI